MTTYFIADTHFDHNNIIKYCHRPFHNVTEMNETMRHLWNNTVRQSDTVYFLGDMSFGRHSHSAGYWLNHLNGHTIFISGSHDKLPGGITHYSLTHRSFGGYWFLLVHDPNNRPKDWHGWTIHGHKHNSNMKNFPFINGNSKTINVSVEVINYRPVSMDFILSLEIDNIKRMRTVDDKIERR
jgi:calcineurin-like phosphoesterase family protein